MGISVLTFLNIIIDSVSYKLQLYPILVIVLNGTSFPLAICRFLGLSPSWCVALVVVAVLVAVSTDTQRSDMHRYCNSILSRTTTEFMFGKKEILRHWTSYDHFKQHQTTSYICIHHLACAAWTNLRIVVTVARACKDVNAQNSRGLHRGFYNRVRHDDLTYATYIYFAICFRRIT